MSDLIKASNLVTDAREALEESQLLVESYSPEWWQLNRAMNETMRAEHRVRIAMAARGIVAKAMHEERGTVERVEMFALGVLALAASAGLWLLVQAGRLMP